MWTAAAYFDESDDNNRAYAVAGFLGHQHDCVHLDMAWKERLLNKYQIDYFKASELEWGIGQFAKFRDNPEHLDAKFSDREKTLFKAIKIESIESPPLEVLCLAEANRFTPGVTGLTQMNSAPATKAGRYGHCPAVPKLCQNYVTNTRSHDRSLIKSDTHLPKKQVASTLLERTPKMRQ
jgi:hypothetical protein